MRNIIKTAFEDRVFGMVRNLVEYGRYGKDPKKAVKILQKHCPGIPFEKCEKTFHDYMEAYNDAIIFVEDRKEFYLKNHQEKLLFRPSTFSKDEEAFLQSHPDVPRNQALGMISWVFHWRYER